MAGFAWHKFKSRDAMISALKALLVTRLREGIMTRARASLMVSGGSTPRDLYAELASTDLAWERITIGLVDDRWVAEDHPRSNARMIRETLIQNKASTARLLTMKTADADPRDGVRAVTAAYNTIPSPYDMVLLGLGADGHTASLFPGAEGLDEAMAAGLHQPLAGLTAQKSDITGEEVLRMTLTPSAIVNARDVVLMITGQEKADILERAILQNADLPIMQVAAKVPNLLNIYWAP